jgi:hypothetical protein
MLTIVPGQTSVEFDSIITNCRDIFIKKMKDYGTAWRILRTSSITDQIFIKAQRIRSIEEKGVQKINEDVSSEYVGIINYAVMALTQMELGETDSHKELPFNEALKYYDKYTGEAKALMENKNHDYGEAWRKMRISSLTDLILMKLLRIKQIEDNKGETIISEGVEANYFDIINYAVFALIRLENKTN